MDNGNLENYKGLEYLFGQIKENIKDNIEWTKNKEREYINFLMEKFLMDNGLMVNNMEMEKLFIQMEQ